MSERKQIEDGGPAFPRVPVVDPVDAVVHCKGHEGMTLRDWFAGQALAGILANPKSEDRIGEFARMAYKLSDAMIEERGKK